MYFKQKLSVGLLAVFIIIFSATMVGAQNNQQTSIRPQYKKAAAVYDKALAGDVPSQYLLGKWYGFTGDPDSAIIWLKKAAEAGLAEAQLELAEILSESEESYGEASQWLERAARQGNTEAKKRLSELN